MQFLHTLGWLACIVYSTIPPFWLIARAGVRDRNRRGDDPDGG